MKVVQIGEVSRTVKSWNPAAASDEETFTYIDISSVSQERKLVEVGPPILTSNAPSRARQLVETDDILVSTVRPNLNAVARVPPELDGATASTGFCVLRPAKSLVDPAYLFHWVRSPDFVSEMVKLATGQSYPAVSDKIIKGSKIPLPPLAEQKRIAAILDQADALRRLRARALDRLNALGQAIFHEMFGDPEHNPKGFKRAVLGDLISSASDGPHVSPNYAETGIPFISARHVRPGQILWKDLKYLSQQDAETQWRKCRPRTGDVLYTKGGTTGLAAQVDVEFDFAVWVHVALLKPRLELVHPAWLVSMLNSPFCYRQSQAFTHGVTNRDLGLKRMVKIEMLAPPLSKQIEFVKALHFVTESLKRLTGSQMKAEALFTSLQHRAFRGAL